MKTKKTAKIRQANAAKWFHWRGCPLKRKVTTIVKTVNDIASWMTFSCMILNGPPFPWKPILLAGTWAQYSKNARPHDRRMTRINGQPVEIFISCNFRCPYHANVIKILDVTRRRIVKIAFIIYIIMSMSVNRNYSLRNRSKPDGRYIWHGHILRRQSYSIIPFDEQKFVIDMIKF